MVVLHKKRKKSHHLVTPRVKYKKSILKPDSAERNKTFDMAYMALNEA